MNPFIQSLISIPALIAILVVVTSSFVIFSYNQQRGVKSLSTQSVVAIGIGAALYGVLSLIIIPIGPNSSFRIAIALLPIFGAIFGPLVAFLVGFIGHALNDAITNGSIWWSWVFLSATLGLFGGLITLDKSFNVYQGLIEKKHIFHLYLLNVVSIVPASLVAFLGDVFLYGEPARKVWLQIILASISNIVVVSVIGVPTVIALTKRHQKNANLETE